MIENRCFKNGMSFCRVSKFQPQLTDTFIALWAKNAQYKMRHCCQVRYALGKAPTHLFCVSCQHWIDTREKYFDIRKKRMISN